MINFENGDHIIFYTSCGDVYVKPIYFTYDNCDLNIEGGMDEGVIADNDEWRSKIFLLIYFFF